MPNYFHQVMQKNRNVYAINACIAGQKPIVSKIRASVYYSGRISVMDQFEVDRINREMGSNATYVYVPCFSLNTILRAIQVEHVDYFSLDVEGGEMSVLTSMNFGKLDITTFSIEYNGHKDREENFDKLMVDKGYRKTKVDHQDLYYIKSN